jgi:uncharacterized membrane protein YkvA (DUF1232 family)
MAPDLAGGKQVTFAGSSMIRNLGRIRALLLDTPRNVMVAYSLFRDDRVPPGPKAALLGAFGFIVSPLDVPAWIPVIGELDILALGTLAITMFIEACPDELVHEHQAAVSRHESLFHRDARRFGEIARERAAEAANAAIVRWRERRSTSGSSNGQRTA